MLWKSSKAQHPSTREIPITKLQTAHWTLGLGFGAWRLSRGAPKRASAAAAGAWMLELGAFREIACRDFPHSKMRNDFDLDVCPFRERRNLNGRARRMVRREVLGIHLVHSCEI